MPWLKLVVMFYLLCLYILWREIRRAPMRQDWAEADEALDEAERIAKTQTQEYRRRRIDRHHPKALEVRARTKT
jgi:uncharacterized membrane protein